MNSSAFVRYDNLIDHPANLLFTIHDVHSSFDKVCLQFVARDAAQAPFESAGICALLADYAARKAGNLSIGPCFVCESEINLNTLPNGKSVYIATSIQACDPTDASFSCQIFNSNTFQQELMGESHGTLLQAQM